MSLVSRFSAVLSVAALCFALLPGCGGGDGPVFPELVVGQIKGPDRLNGGSFGTYSIEAQGDTSISYEWSVEPANAGCFANATSGRATFCPASVLSDAQVTIRVSVKSAYEGPESRSLEVVICRVEDDTGGKLIVSDIIGPATVTGGTWTTYGVEASGDTGIRCRWSVDPASVGTVTHPESRYTNFAATAVESERSASLRVEVASDNCEPVTKTLGIAIAPGKATPPGLAVGNITGPAAVIENSTVSYSVTAHGDTGIRYEWSVDPPERGHFDFMNEPSANFTASPLKSPMVKSVIADIIVTVTSDNSEPQVRTQRIAIHPTGPTVGWVEAPTIVEEDTVVTYAIDTDAYLGILIDEPMTLRWECDPIYAGTFMVAMGSKAGGDYYITSTYTPDVLFRASEVQADTPAMISVFWKSQLLDSIDITILDMTNKPVDSHWYEQSAIVGPTQVIEATTDVFYYSVPDGDPDWHYNWSVSVVDDWDHNMPYFGQLPPPYPGTLQPTRDENGEWTWQLMELIANNFDMETWLQLRVECPGGPHTFLVLLKTVEYPCLFVTEIFQARYWSGFDSLKPRPPEAPEEPWLDMTVFDLYGKDQLREGDIVRLFVVIDSYRPDDFLKCSWETEPADVVHFWGDEPFEFEQEEDWRDYGSKICDPQDLKHCGSRYYLPGGRMGIVGWVELTCHTNERFDVVLTVESFECNTAIRVRRFNDN